MFVVDTNLLLYAANPKSPDHPAARELVEGWRSEGRPWFLTWGIAYEFLRVSTHRRVFPRPLKLQEARGWLDLLLATPGVAVLTETDRHRSVLEELAGAHPRLAGNTVHDLHTAALMWEHGVSEIRTADTDFHQFPFVRAVNPLVG